MPEGEAGAAPAGGWRGWVWVLWHLLFVLIPVAVFGISVFQLQVRSARAAKGSGFRAQGAI